MDTPSRAPAPFQRVQPDNRAAVAAGPIEPSAIASGRSSAIFSLGDVLRRLIDHSLAFPTENAKLAAYNTVNDYVGAHVADRELSALMTGDERAPVEDVSQRTPPNIGGPVAYTAPGLDYTKLAQAILREQQRLQARPAVEPPEDSERS